MKSLTFSVLLTLTFSGFFATTAYAAKPPSGDMNPSDMGNTTVDTSELRVPTGRPAGQRVGLPPSGDMNLSDLGNTTVDTSELRVRERKPVVRRVGLPPSGDMNPSDMGNTTVDTSGILSRPRNRRASQAPSGANPSSQGRQTADPTAHLDPTR
jgi:hypothetical protein